MYENRERNRATAYEYKNITVPNDMKMVYADGYAHFGWEYMGMETGFQGNLTVVLKFKRDRRLKDRNDLNRLEREFENGLKEVERLERKKSASIMASALGAGVAGLAFLAGAVVSFMAGGVFLGVVLLIPALGGCVMGFVNSIRVRAKKELQTAPQIDGHYDAVYQACEEAHTLLNSAA